MYYILEQDWEVTHVIDYDIPSVWISNRYKLFSCKRIDTELPPIVFYLNAATNLPDLLPNDKQYLLLNNELRKLIEKFLRDPIQYLKVKVKHKKYGKAVDSYLMANILTEVNAINYKKSLLQYHKKGGIQFVDSLVLDESKIENHAIFRLAGCGIPVILREDLVNEIQINNCTGLTFSKPENYQL